MRERIIKILKNINEEIVNDYDTDLIVLGIIDSFDIATIITEVEDSFNIEIDIEQVSIEKFRTVNLMIEFFEKVIEQ